MFRVYVIKEQGEYHPKLIVDENNQDNTYGFMGLTEHKYNGHHLNIKLEKNPRRGDTREAYIRKELRKDKKNNFGGVLTNYELSEKDEEKVDDYLNKKKK